MALPLSFFAAVVSSSRSSAWASDSLRRAYGWAGTWPLRALAPATGTAGTTETTGIAPAWRFAQGIGSLGQRASCALHWRPIGGPRNGRDARCPSGFAQANCPARKPPSRWSRRSRPARQKMKFLVGGPPTPSGTPQKIFSSPLAHHQPICYTTREPLDGLLTTREPLAMRSGAGRNPGSSIFKRELMHKQG